MQRIKLASDDGHFTVDHLLHEVKVFHHGCALTLTNADNGFSAPFSPLDEINGEDRLSEVDEQPIITLDSVAGVLQVSLLGDIVQRFDHHVLQLEQPMLDWSLGNHRRGEGNEFRLNFRFSRLHSNDISRILCIRELDPADVIETLPEMLLNRMRVPGLRQDLKQFIVTEKVEPRKSTSFGLKVVLETLLDILQHFVVGLELLEQFLRIAAILHQGSFIGLHHDILPELIHLEELRCLLR